jgi:DNA-binding transcriptional ArsR family regulator
VPESYDPHVIAYRFGREDLLRTRFAISPLFELAASTRVLRDPGGHSVHLPWVREARARLAGFDYALLDALHPIGPYAPDFVAPPPLTPLPNVEEELARVRATPPERVRLELGWTFEGGEVPASAQPLLDDPAAALPALVELMAGYWERAIAPWWGAIRAVLEADIRQRSRRLASGGALELFADLHPDVRWHDGALLVDRRHEAEVELAGRGLQLVPAAFGWPRVGAMLDPPWQPSLIYAPRGVGDLWAPATARHGEAAGEEASGRGGRTALGDLLGRRRAGILVALAAEATTTELASRLAASPGGVSEHLGVLRRAGLVRARREGRTVVYSRTAAGDVLTAPSPSPGSPS